MKDPLLYTKYIGVLTVLGSIKERQLNSDQSQSRILAFNDANDFLEKNKRGIRFHPSTSGFTSVEVKEKK